MAIYRLKIVGVHYAVNPDSASSAEETELMHQRTAQRLSELDATRPRIVLVPEPTNPVDPRAVMARVMGKRIGYVDKTQLDVVHSLLQGNGGRALIASIVEVEARKHGWLYVALEASGEMPVEPLPKAEDAWKEWTSTIPAIAPDEAYFAREEAEVMLDDVLSKHPIMRVPSGVAPQRTFSPHPIVIQTTEGRKNLEDTKPGEHVDAHEILRRSAPLDDKMGEDAQNDINNEEEKLCDTPCDSVVKTTPQIDIDIIEHYIRLWLESSLHDLSNEARLTREHYIMRLKQMTPQNEEPSLQEPPLQIRALVSELEKQRTAICGQKRSTLRVARWWKELMKSDGMQHLWNTWLTRMGGDMEQSMSEMDTLLRALPFDLYAYIDDKKLFFSRLHYSGVPRTKYWQIVSLMLLRERALRIMEVNAANRMIIDLVNGEGEDETSHPWGNESFSQEEGRCPVLGHPYDQEAETRNETFEVVIPKELQSPEAKKIIAKLQKKGYLDADLQPVGLSGAKKGVLAWELCDFLGIKHCWKIMGTLWKCNGETIRKARDKGIMRPEIIDFTKIIKALLY